MTKLRRTMVNKPWCRTKFVNVSVGNVASSCSPTLSIETTKLPVKVGHDVIIKCRACGRKDIFWFKDGKRFGENERVHWIAARKVSSYPLIVEGKLRIEKLRKHDRGVYTCYALNFFTNIMEKGEIMLAGKFNCGTSNLVTSNSGQGIF